METVKKIPLLFYFYTQFCYNFEEEQFYLNGKVISHQDAYKHLKELYSTKELFELNVIRHFPVMDKKNIYKIEENTFEKLEVFKKQLIENWENVVI